MKTTHVLLTLSCATLSCVAPRPVAESLPAPAVVSTPPAISAADLDALWSRLRSAVDTLWARGVGLDELAEVLRDVDELRRAAVDSTLTNAANALREAR